MNCSFQVHDFRIFFYPQEAVDYLYSHPNVLPGGVGVIGISKGGEIALHMSTSSEKVKYPALNPCIDMK